MPPGWVTDLNSYWRWLEDEIEGSGGYLENDVLVVQLYPDEDGSPSLLTIPRQRLIFHDGSYLDLSLLVDLEDFEVIEYHFHYARGDHTLVWRHDKHDGHPGVFRTHVHWPPDERAESCPEVEFSDVSDLIVIDQDQGDRGLRPGP